MLISRLGSSLYLEVVHVEHVSFARFLIGDRHLCHLIKIGSFLVLSDFHGGLCFLRSFLRNDKQFSGLKRVPMSPSFKANLRDIQS